MSDLFLVLRRQPWNQWAGRALTMIKGLLQLALPIALLPVLLLPIAAHARTYDVFTANVPFKFNVGDRSFSPGYYEFIFSGHGLVSIRDSHAQVVATFITRSISAAAPAAASKLVFSHQKKGAYLNQIWIESQSQGTEILGEELAMHSPDQPIPAIQMYGFAGYERNPIRFRD